MEKKESDVTRTLVIGLAIGLILGGVIGFLYSNTTEREQSFSSALEADQVKVTAEAYINQNLLNPGIRASIENITERSGMYELDIMLTGGAENQFVTAHISRDGKLFFPDLIDLTAPVSTQPSTSAAPATSPASDKETDMRGINDDDPWAGNKDAKVIIVEFSDFQCPFCRQTYPTVKQIIKTYGDQILFVYRDFPIHSLHPQAGKAAEAAQCAYEQDSFWEYHDTLFEKQNDWASGGVPRFKKYAEDLGLDTDAFNECLDTGRYTSEVGIDLKDGMFFGVSGTPTFFINGRKLSGSQPFSAFKTIIDEELAKTG